MAPNQKSPRVFPEFQERLKVHVTFKDIQSKLLSWVQCLVSVRTFSIILSLLANHQIRHWVTTAALVKWAINLVITRGYFNLLQGSVWIWVNMLNLSLPRTTIHQKLSGLAAKSEELLMFSSCLMNVLRYITRCVDVTWVKFELHCARKLKVARMHVDQFLSVHIDSRTLGSSLILHFG